MILLRKIFSPLSLIISCFLIIYLFYRSEIHHDGLKDEYYLKYYIILILLILFSIISFFLSKKIKDYLIISVISIIFSLYISEGYLLYKYQIKKEIAYEKKTGKKYDTRIKLEFFEHKKIKNKDIKLSFHKGYLKKEDTIFPFGGISNVETIHCNENGYYSTYKSDRYGFNNPDEEWENTNLEYVLLGDSYTQGACVNRPNDISSVLRILSNKSVLNLGYSSNSPLIEYAVLREYIEQNVKNVIWMYYERNDLKGLENELKNKILINYFINPKFSQNLKNKQFQIDNLINKIIIREQEQLSKIEIDNLKNRIIKFIKIFRVRLIFNKNRYLMSIENLTKPQPEFKKILQLTKDFTKKRNMKLYFVYLPEYARYSGKYDNTNYLKVKKIIEELDIEFIDIPSEVFDKEDDPRQLFPFQLMGHYNSKGYKKVANKIYEITSR